MRLAVLSDLGSLRKVPREDDEVGSDALSGLEEGLCDIRIVKSSKVQIGSVNDRQHLKGNLVL
mgnify:CR=1 FL=1